MANTRTHTHTLAPAPICATAPVGGDGAVVLERQSQRTQPPPMHQVVLLNDDFTPMEFVVAVIQEFFYHNRDAAMRIMLAVHTSGKGVCGTYTADVAQTKVAQVLEAASQNGHPLQCLAQPLE